MKKVACLTLFICSIFFTEIAAQVTISPTNMFIDQNSRFGTYMVINNSNEPQEIEVEFFFGYSQTDNTGERRVIYNDSTAADKYSIVDYVRAFPQNFIVQPGQRQIVRLRINAPRDLSEGTHWARIKTSATPESPPVEIATNDAVSARVAITIEQVTGLFYKSGDVTTGIEIEDIRTEIEDGQLIVLSDYLRKGNSPFLGSITVSLVDRSNKTVAESYISTSLYFDGTHKQLLDISGLGAGNYTVKVDFRAQRSDIPESDIIKMEPVVKTSNISIP